MDKAISRVWLVLGGRQGVLLCFSRAAAIQLMPSHARASQVSLQQLKVGLAIPMEAWMKRREGSYAPGPSPSLASSLAPSEPANQRTSGFQSQTLPYALRGIAPPVALSAHHSPPSIDHCALLALSAAFLRPGTATAYSTRIAHFASGELRFTTRRRRHSLSRFLFPLCLCEWR